MAIQAVPGTYGTKGDYELVGPLEGGGLGHFYRNNDDPTLPWFGPIMFATEELESHKLGISLDPSLPADFLARSALTDRAHFL